MKLEEKVKNELKGNLIAILKIGEIEYYKVMYYEANIVYEYYKIEDEKFIKVIDKEELEKVTNRMELHQDGEY